jgi:hypothetical protein
MLDLKKGAVFARLLLVSLVSGSAAGCGLTKQPEPEFPITFELGMGMGRRVPYAATLRFLTIEEGWDHSTGGVSMNAVVEMECKGKEHHLSLKKDQVSEPVCGVRVRLVGILEPERGNNPSSLPRAYFALTKAE